VSPIEYVFLINDGSDSCRTHLRLASLAYSLNKIFSKDGILKTYYSDEDLVDLRKVCFPGLNSIDTNLLLEISHIQACQKNWTANEAANPL
jgi:hypothetical protein